MYHSWILNSRVHGAGISDNVPSEVSKLAHLGECDNTFCTQSLTVTMSDGAPRRGGGSSGGGAIG